MKYLRSGVTMSCWSPVNSCGLIQEQRIPIAQAPVAIGKAVACTIRAAAFGFLLAAGLPLVAQAQIPSLLFQSGYEPSKTINAVSPSDCWLTPSGCWQHISGTDTTTGFTWPPSIWGGGGSAFLLLADTPGVTAENIGDYMFNQIVTVKGHTGNLSNQALYSQVTKGPSGQNPMGTASTTNLFELTPSSETSDLYISYWLKLPPGTAKNMSGLDAGPGIANDGGTWRTLWAFKTGTPPAHDDGDYRVEAYVSTQNSAGTLYWAIGADNNAGGNYPVVNSWSYTNSSVPVPEGVWFKLEFFWHRSPNADGRVWMAVNGTQIFNVLGANMGSANLPINRVTVNSLYSGGLLPIYQWVDDLQIWDGFPPACTVPPPVWCDPPYAPH